MCNIARHIHKKTQSTKKPIEIVFIVKKKTSPKFTDMKHVFYVRIKTIPCFLYLS